MLEFDPHVLDEKPIPPPEEFSKRAHVKSLEEYRKMFEYAERDPEGFWGEQAKMLDWFEPYSQVLEWKLPHAKWFVGGKLNVSYNCLDRHVEKDANKPALFWEAEDGATLELTYAELHERVCRFANALLNLGVKAGDCVAIYLPMIPELPIAMLACARIGAIHSVIFGGFSATALVDRIADAKSKILITADGGYRRGKVVPLKDTADAALKNCPTIEKSIVVKRTGEKVAWQEGRDLWWHDLEEAASKDCPAAPFDSEHPLYILYTSGTTGKPKGVLHTSAGYLLQTMWSTKLVFDLRDDDVYWCTADIGWVTGHSYIVYGPLASGASIVMYEGAPDHPRKDRFWEIVERYKVTIFYSSATAVRAFMAWGTEWLERHNTSQPPPARHGRRTDQSRRVEMVFRGHRKKSLPHRGYVVADGNRRDYDFSAPRRDADEARLRHAAASRRDRQGREYKGRTGRPRRNRLSDHPEALALHAAHHLWRRRALRTRILEPHSRRLFRRRCRAMRQGRLHLGPRPRRRRHQSRRPSPQLDGNRKRAGQPSVRRGSGRCRAPG